MKEKNNNNFSYATSKGVVVGAFNVYQARSGLVYLVMQDGHTPLSLLQLKALHIDVSVLLEFDEALFQSAYRIGNSQSKNQKREIAFEDVTKLIESLVRASPMYRAVLKQSLEDVCKQPLEESLFLNALECLQEKYCATLYGLQFSFNDIYVALKSRPPAEILPILAADADEVVSF